MKKISIVTIVYNDVAHISNTIESVLSQSARSEIEYIIVDGLSTDGTSEQIETYLDRIDVYLREKDSGIYNAMNKGIALATGDYIIFMNSGDCFSDIDAVKTIIEAIERHSIHPALVYGDYREMKDGVFTKTIPSRNPQWIWYGAVASHQSTFYNLAFLRQHGLSYDESYRIAADYKLTLEIIAHAEDRVLRVPACISDFDTNGCSCTNQTLGLKEANRARREVLAWGKLRIALLTAILLSARYAKRYAAPIYKFIRY